MDQTNQDPSPSTAEPIIMVDDSHVDFDIAKRMFERTKLHNPLVHCDSGPALLAYLDEYEQQSSVPIRLILMDINMPGMDGIETVAKIRQRPQFVETPIIAILTSSADPNDQKRATAAGANDYFLKPMNPADYLPLFTSLVAHQPTPTSPAR